MSVSCVSWQPGALSPVQRPEGVTGIPATDCSAELVLQTVRTRLSGPRQPLVNEEEPAAQRECFPWWPAPRTTDRCTGSPCYTSSWLPDCPHKENTGIRVAGSRDTGQLAEGRETRLMGNRRETVFLSLGDVHTMAAFYLKNQRPGPLLNLRVGMLCASELLSGVAAVGTEGPTP